MKHDDNYKNQEIISIEEYLNKRKKIKEREERKRTAKIMPYREKSSAFIWAELYM